MQEEWRQICGLNYEVSNLGNVRSTDIFIRSRAGNPYLKKGKNLSQITDSYGYKRVNLHGNGMMKLTQVHRLVLLAFVGDPPDGTQGCHNDGDKTNNCVSNLRWDTPKKNIEDRTAHGKGPRGDRNPRAVLKECDVLAIRKDARKYPEIACDYQIDRTTVGDIKRRKTWGWLQD